ncbi:MAG: EamA family transporter [Bacteroidetes bacterium]|nr:MAG: EamA family transporter [Bacteroidota bacterium]REJ99749.1 MAG: EamA family transporter [Bacteroidota bacterium]REK34122.1 MAG: EamA family transporter [Bacteroidota bacterium]REK50453.1 MAG: EamA family transporter [Bacteroidota bacterium]
MSFTGINFALLATLSWAIGIFPFTQAARRLGVSSLNHFRLILACVLVFSLSLSIRPSQLFEIFSEQHISAWIWLGLSGIIGMTIGDHFGFAAFRILGARLGSVLMTLAPAAALFAGFFLNGDRMSLIGMAGIIITICGVMWISLGRSERKLIPDYGHGSIIKGILFGLISALCQGTGLVMAQKGIFASGEIYPVHATFMRLLCATLSLFIFSTLTGKIADELRPVIKNQNNGIKFAVSGTMFGPVIGVTLSIFTVFYINAAVAQTIFSLVPVFALFIAYFLIKDRISPKALAGVIVAVAGVIILIWRDKLNELF